MGDGKRARFITLSHLPAGRTGKVLDAGGVPMFANPVIIRRLPCTCIPTSCSSQGLLRGTRRGGARITIEYCILA
jgi:hypothetical protein